VSFSSHAESFIAGAISIVVCAVFFVFVSLFRESDLDTDEDSL
jgi:hypothetical protein